MSDILTLSQIKVPGTATSKDDAIREAGQLLVDAGAVEPGVRGRDVRAGEVGVHLHGQLPGDPARHQRGQGRDQPVGALGRPLRRRRSTGTATRCAFAVGIAGVNNGHLEILGKIAHRLLRPRRGRRAAARRPTRPADERAASVTSQPTEDRGHSTSDEDMKALRFYAPEDVRLEDVPEPRVRPGRGQAPGPQLLDLRHRREDLPQRPPEPHARRAPSATRSPARSSRSAPTSTRRTAASWRSATAPR